MKKMSKNDVILVVADRRSNITYYYVLFNVCADTGWNEQYAKQQISKMKKFTTSRSKALVLAHDLQKKINSEYGVQEYDVC